MSLARRASDMPRVSDARDYFRVASPPAGALRVGMQGIPLALPMRMSVPPQLGEGFRFADRQAAGIALSRQLRHFGYRDDVIGLALPRGGVPVGYEVARVLGAPMDVFAVRKLGILGHSELAMGR